MGFSGSGTISGSCDVKESTCTFLSRCLAYLWTSWGSWKTSLKIFVICTGWISAAWASGVSSIVLCRGIVRGDVTGRVRLCILENRRRQPESGLSVTFLDCSRCQTKGFSHPIHVTTKCYSSYQQYYNYYPHYQGCWRNWPGESIVCFYHGRSLVPRGSNPWYPEELPE